MYAVVTDLISLIVVLYLLQFSGVSVEGRQHAPLQSLLDRWATRDGTEL